MATSTYVPVEVYLRSSYEPDAEYVDGEVEKRPMGEHDHAAWQKAILLWFAKHEHEWNIEVLPEYRVQVSSTRFRVPDVAVMDFSLPAEPVATRPPIAVFEVLSPEDTMRRMRRKLDDYAKMGIPQIWLIDPEDAACFRYVNGELLRAELFEEPARGISFSIAEIGGLVSAVGFTIVPSSAHRHRFAALPSLLSLQRLVATSECASPLEHSFHTRIHLFLFDELSAIDLVHPYLNEGEEAILLINDAEGGFDDHLARRLLEMRSEVGKLCLLFGSDLSLHRPGVEIGILGVKVGSPLTLKRRSRSKEPAAMATAPECEDGTCTKPA